MAHAHESHPHVFAFTICIYVGSSVLHVYAHVCPYFTVHGDFQVDMEGLDMRYDHMYCIADFNMLVSRLCAFV